MHTLVRITCCVLLFCLSIQAHGAFAANKNPCVAPIKLHLSNILEYELKKNHRACVDAYALTAQITSVSKNLIVVKVRLKSGIAYVKRIRRGKEVSVGNYYLQQDFPVSFAHPTSRLSILSKRALYIYKGSFKRITSIPAGLKEIIVPIRQQIPVCAELKGGKATYENEEAASEAGATVLYPGNCEENVACTAQYDPVCAMKNGEIRHYSNACVAKVAGAIVVESRSCFTFESF